jgi:hypothetical protein
MLPAKRHRSIEELLGRHRKELGFVGRPVRIEQRAPSLLRLLAEEEILAGTDPGPCLVLRPVMQRRGAVGAAVQHVEFVGELVVDHVVAALRVSPSPPNRIPDEDDGTSELGFAENGKGGLDGSGGDLEGRWTLRGYDDRRRIDEDRVYIAVVIVRKFQDQKAGLSRDRDSDFVCEFQTSTAFPMFLVDEDANEITQMSSLLCEKPTVVRHIAPDHGFPVVWEGQGEELSTSTLTKPMQHAGGQHSGRCMLKTSRTSMSCLCCSAGIDAGAWVSIQVVLTGCSRM